MTFFNDSIRITRPLLSGGHFDTFEAVDTLLDRRVFLKVARPTDDDVARQVVAAHVAQWRTLSRAEVACLPTIYTLGQKDDAWFLTTEWIDGRSLREVFESGVADTGDRATFLDVLLNLCLAALKLLHARDLTHGDLTPGNILVDAGLTRVRLVDPAPSLAGIDTGAALRRLILANRHFTAPEVLAGGTTTVRSDLFALGILFQDAAGMLGMDPPLLVRHLTAADADNRPPSVDAAERWLNRSDSFLPPASAAMIAHPPALDVDHGNEMAPPGQAPSPWISSTQIVAVPSAASTALRSAPASWAEASVAIGVEVPQAADKGGAIPADFSIVAPPHIEPGRHFVVEVWAVRSGELEQMLAQATVPGRMVERRSRSHIDLTRDTIINVVLTLPDFEITEPVATLGWNGDIRNVGFMVKAPPGLAPGLYPGVAKLMQGQVPFASIWFDLEVASIAGRAEPPASPLSARVQRINRAFASYASQDRGEVLRCIQGIQAAGTSVFMDIVALRAGEDWERTLYREINACDGLFLFWSRNALESPWVEREWRYALEQRGLSFINPLALEDPRLVEPPVELRSKHFNDMLLAFIANEAFVKSRSRS